MKYWVLALLTACAQTPPAPQPIPCISIEEMQQRTQKMSELTKLLTEDTQLLGEVAQETRRIGQKFARLSRSYETASPQTLLKLQGRRLELEAEAKANEQEGSRLQIRLKRVQEQLDVETQQLHEDRPVCLPKVK